MSIADHLADIDFRKKEVRQASAPEEFKRWYDAMQDRQAQGYDGRIQAQLEVLSAVLWHVLPDKEYKKFMKRPKPKNLTILL